MRLTGCTASSEYLRNSLEKRPRIDAEASIRLDRNPGMEASDGENHRRGAVTGLSTASTDYDPIKYAPSQCNLHNMY